MHFLIDFHPYLSGDKLENSTKEQYELGRCLNIQMEEN